MSALSLVHMLSNDQGKQPAFSGGRFLAALSCTISNRSMIYISFLGFRLHSSSEVIIAFKNNTIILKQHIIYIIRLLWPLKARIKCS